MKSSGILYFLANEAMPGLIKIGHTTGSLENRMLQLNTTATPAPFEAIAFFKVNNSALCERKVHKVLSKYRSNPKREFFSASISVLLRDSIKVISSDIKIPLEGESESNTFLPDEDDIHFMYYLVWAYEEKKFLSSAEIKEDFNYTILEIELKLFNLEEQGYITRVNHVNDGLALWSLLPKGLKYMMYTDHHMQICMGELRSRDFNAKTCVF